MTRVSTRVSLIALLAASATATIVLTTSGASAQSVYGANCRPDVVYRPGSYCDRVVRAAAANVVARPAWGAAAVGTAVGAAGAAAYVSGDYAAGLYRPAGSYGGASATYGVYPASTAYDAYPTRDVYRQGYVPASYFGPTCHPRLDVGCQ